MNGVRETVAQGLSRNDSPGGWVVQKFGGTSVGKFPDKIAHDIVREYVKQNKVVVVCSARSTGKKAEGTTSRLLGVYKKLQGIGAAIREEERQNQLLDEAKSLIEDICSDHICAAQQFLENGGRDALLEEVRKECQELIEYIVAAKRFNLEVNSRSKDRVISFGEKLSCRFMTAYLEDVGVAAEYVDLADAFHFPISGRVDDTFYREATVSLKKRLLTCGDRVPVVTGFFGNVPGSLMDGDIGRGYTDLCSALCAVAVGAEELQVWKEVDGIFTADPSKVPTARLLPSITPSEAAELTFYGSEVIHHLTMDQVIKASPPIPIRIKNVRNPRGQGTIIVPDAELTAGKQMHQPHRHHQQPSDSPVSSSSPSSTTTTPVLPPPFRRKRPKRPTAVTIKDAISVINVHSNKRSISHGFFARVFSVLDAHQISVDLISTSEVHVSMAVHAASLVSGVFDEATAELGRECGDVTVLHDMAILSLVGADMKQMIGIAGRMFSTLGEHSVNIEMISQGASEINISCVVEARDATRAMNVLHTHLFTFLE